MGMRSEDRFDAVARADQPDPAKHYAVFILDRSGSMTRIGVEAVDAFNQQVKNIRANLAGKDHIAVEVSLVTFSSQVDEPELWCTPLADVQPLTEEDFTPAGMTAMYDAVGDTITRLSQRADINDPRTSVLVIIISDGEENSSRRFTAQNIASMVKEMQATGRWTFVYEGANQELSEVAVTTNISTGNMLHFDATPRGMASATMRRVEASKAFYGTVVEDGGNLSVQNFYGNVADQTFTNDETTEPEIPNTDENR